MFIKSRLRESWEKTICINKYLFGYVNGIYQLFLFNGASSEADQQCVLHESCGATLCVGEMVLVELCTAESGKQHLKGFRIRQGLKSCCVGNLELNNETKLVLTAFDRSITQVDFLSEDETNRSKNVNGCIKLLVIGVKDAPQLK